MNRFNDQEIVALIGAHALGRCHTDRSGFEGPWTFSPTTMTNEFYKLLFNEYVLSLLTWTYAMYLLAFLGSGAGVSGVDLNNMLISLLEH